MSEFVDTSVFIRLLTGDDPRKAARSLALMQRARSGEVELVTSESVVAEVVYVLSSAATYRMPRLAIRRALLPVLGNPGLKLGHKGSILSALALWESSALDFEDCLSVEHIRRAHLGGIYSYDRDFDRVPGIAASSHDAPRYSALP